MNYNNKQEFSIDNFNGPLDSLVSLLKEKKLSINEINLIKISNQFFDLVNDSKLDFENVGEYLIVISNLIKLKSNFFLHKKKTHDIDDSGEEELLVKRLVEYDNYKKLSIKLGELYSESQNYYEKNYERELIEKLKPSSDLTNFSVHNLNNENIMNAALKLLSKIEISHKEIKIVKQKISIEQRDKELKDYLFKNKGKKINFMNLFDHYDSYYISITFLLILEYVRWENVKIWQENETKEIYLKLN